MQCEHIYRTSWLSLVRTYIHVHAVKLNFIGDTDCQMDCKSSNLPRNKDFTINCYGFRPPQKWIPWDHMNLESLTDKMADSNSCRVSGNLIGQSAQLDWQAGNCFPLPRIINWVAVRVDVIVFS